MGTPKSPCRVKLIAGLLANDSALFEKAKTALARLFGRIDFESAVLDFRHTDYYDTEMGKGLKRKFISFERPVSLNNIFRVKLKTNDIERRFLRNGKRSVNIDPGYLEMSKIVLFSTKDYSHRIYSGSGIFSEVTLLYNNRRFNPLPWTYPDYRTKEYADIFESIRNIHKVRQRPE